MENIKRFFAPDPDDSSMPADKVKTEEESISSEEIKTELPKAEKLPEEKHSSFKDALQQWSNNDAADTAFDDTQV